MCLWNCIFAVRPNNTTTLVVVVCFPFFAAIQTWNNAPQLPTTLLGRRGILQHHLNDWQHTAMRCCVAIFIQFLVWSPPPQQSEFSKLYSRVATDRVTCGESKRRDCLWHTALCRAFYASYLNVINAQSIINVKASISCVARIVSNEPWIYLQ